MLDFVEPVRGHAYIINRRMYVWDTVKWAEVGQVGPAGKSAYDLAKLTGQIEEGTTITQYLESLKGQSAFQLAREFELIPSTWTIEDYLESLQGKSVYELAVENGFVVPKKITWLLWSARRSSGPRGLLAIRVRPQRH